MKKSTALLASLVAVGVAGGLYFGVTKSEASATPEDQAEKAVQIYFDALKSGNVDKIMQITDDRRYEDNKAKLEAYKDLAMVSKIKKTELLSFERVDATHMKAAIQLTDDNNIMEQTVPVEIVNGQWKVVIKRHNQ